MLCLVSWPILFDLSVLLDSEVLNSRQLELSSYYNRFRLFCISKGWLFRCTLYGRTENFRAFMHTGVGKKASEKAGSDVIELFVVSDVSLTSCWRCLSGNRKAD